MSAETYSLIELEDLSWEGAVPVERVHRYRDWSSLAACRDAGPMDFFVGDGEPSSPVPWRVYEAALTYCAGCPVLAECAAEAEKHKHIGLWAGVWHYEVSKLPRRRSVNLLKRRRVS